MTSSIDFQRLSEEDQKTLRFANGLYTGQLSDAEMEAFNRAVKLGLAERVYLGAGGFLGMAKVRLLDGARS